MNLPMKEFARSPKVLIHSASRLLNHAKAAPVRVVGNTLQHKALE